MIKLLHELPLILGFATFTALNVYLWSPVTAQEILCATSVTLGVFYFAGMMRLVMRYPPKNGDRKT